MVNRFIGCVFMLLTVGCAHVKPGPAQNSASTLVNVTPSGKLALRGSYDFDLIGHVSGEACASYTDKRFRNGVRPIAVNGSQATYHVAVPGFDQSGGPYDIQGQSEAAAVFDALGKLEGADLVFVTRSRTLAKSEDSVCTTVWGQAVRLKKGYGPADDVAHPHHDEQPPAAVPSPAEVPPPAPPAPPAAKKKAP